MQTLETTPVEFTTKLPATDNSHRSLVMAQMAVGILVLLTLYPLSRHNYLLYHGIVEILSVVVAITLFSIGWNSRHYTNNTTLLIIAVAYLPIGVLDFLHVLSYKGMGVFPTRGADLPTQLWIAARYLESGSLLAAASLLRRRILPPIKLLLFYLALGVVLIAVIIPWPLFPTCFDPAEGLTTFKVVSEYLISLLLAIAAVLFWQRRHEQDATLLNLLLASVVVTICSELSLTLYVDVYGLSNFIGHACKLLSVYLMYLALVRGSLRSPYRSLFKQLAHELAQRKASEELLTVMNRELDGFVRIISHDLRNHLTPVIGYADYLQERCSDRLSADEVNLLREIEDSGQTMNTMLNDLLDLARVGHLAPPVEQVSAAQVVEQVHLMLTSPLHAAGLQLKIESLPPCWVPKSLLSLVFSNLLGNAIHYGQSHAGTVTVGGFKKGAVVHYFVRDHGKGVDESERERIFELFYRSESDNQRRGTGIGLAIVLKIVRLYDGRVWVEETPGGGATFWVELATNEGLS